MTFTRSELEMIYQYAATDRAATVAGLAAVSYTHLTLPTILLV